MGNIWGIHQLIPHPKAPASAVDNVTAQVLGYDGRALFVEWAVNPRETLLRADPAEPVRTDGLWRSTCFEVFLKSEGSEAYFEFNFSPSFAWAAYGFDRSREGMRPLPLRMDPEIMVSPPEAKDWYFQSAEFDLPELLAGPAMLNLTAVIEERDGTKSYWALSHPPDGPPDFHHPACFTLELPPAPAP